MTDPSNAQNYTEINKNSAIEIKIIGFQVCKIAIEQSKARG